MSDRLHELERLNALRERGTLSEAEYARAKANVLGDVPLAHKGLPQWAWWALFAISLALAIFVIKPLLRTDAAQPSEAIEATDAMGTTQAAPEPSPTVAADFEQLCMLGVFDKPQPLNHPISALFGPARAGGSQVSWESTAQGAIGRLYRVDPLTREEQNLAIEFVRTADAAVVSDCKGVGQGAIATRVSINDEVSQGFGAAVLLQTLLASAAQR